MKQILILVAMILMFTQATCAAQMLPEDSMKKFCNAFLYLDEADLKFFHSSPEELSEKYTNAFESSDSEIKFTNAQANLITDALVETMRQKVKFSIKTESTRKNKAVVAVTITGINFNEEMKNIEFSADNLTAEQIAEVATDEFISRIKNISTKEPVTIKFNLIYNETADIWIPEGEGENNLSPIFEAAL